MTKKTSIIRKSLVKKGFKEENRDHVYLILYDENGNKTNIYTKVSYGKKEYDDKLLALMARQLRLKKNELLDLIECPLDYKGYLSILKSKGEI